jgi:hypothetical protein
MQAESMMVREVQQREARGCYDFPLVLARLMANAPATDRRWPMWRRMYAQLRPVDKLRHKAELHACQLAKRGNVEALLCAS